MTSFQGDAEPLIFLWEMPVSAGPRTEQWEEECRLQGRQKEKLTKKIMRDMKMPVERPALGIRPLLAPAQWGRTVSG